MKSQFRIREGNTAYSLLQRKVQKQVLAEHPEKRERARQQMREYLSKPERRNKKTRPNGLVLKLLCGRQDLNLHASQHENLNLTCLPFHHARRIKGNYLHSR